ncbi:MAG: DUF177 domain-containing protein [Clostridia bacterium]
MQLDVSKAFLTPATPFPFETEGTLEAQDVLGESISFEKLMLKGTFAMLEDIVHLEGTLQTVAHGTCALCMEPADAALTIPFCEDFRKGANETEDESFRYQGKIIPLDHMALTLVMLNLPMRFVCKAGCEGSAELKAWKNEDPMSSCEDGSPIQRPFEALQSLLKKDEEV